jgi:tetratricopeptide (TPR) repeat protein
MKRLVAVAGLMLMVAVQAAAEGAPEEKPSMEEVARQTSERVDKIYAAEGGKRDKTIIRAEYVGNSAIKGMILAAEENLNKQAYENVHAIVVAAGKTIADILKEQPKVRLNSKQIAYLYYLDGDAYGYADKTKEAISAYKKSLDYAKTASAYFQLGTVYMFSKDVKNGDRCYKEALKLDKSIEPKYKETIAGLKKAGIVK